MPIFFTFVGTTRGQGIIRVVVAIFFLYSHFFGRLLVKKGPNTDLLSFEMSVFEPQLAVLLSVAEFVAYLSSHSVQRYWILKQFWNRIFNTLLGRNRMRLLYNCYIQRLTLQLTKICVLRVCNCLLYTSPSPRDRQKSRMPSSA